MSKARDLANAGTALTTVSATELGYLDGVTSAVQTQIDSKIGSASAINPTIVDAKGDIIAATAADTVARLAVGSNDTVLTADSSTATGLKWAAPSSGSLTLLSTTNIGAGTSTVVSGIDQTYTNLRVIVEGVSQTNSGDGIRIAPNATQIDYTGTMAISTTSSSSQGFTNGLSIYNGYGIDANNTNNVFQCDIFQYSSSTQYKPMTLISSCIKSGVPSASWAAGAWRSTSAITSIELWTYFSFNAAGTIKIYGVK